MEAADLSISFGRLQSYPTAEAAKSGIFFFNDCALSNAEWLKDAVFRQQKTVQGQTLPLLTPRRTAFAFTERLTFCSNRNRHITRNIVDGYYDDFFWRMQSFVKDRWPLCSVGRN
jgi:hypothetical protein